MTDITDREIVAALRPYLDERSREFVRAEIADLIADAERALAAVPAPTPTADNPLYYPLLFLLRGVSRSAPPLTGTPNE